MVNINRGVVLSAEKRWQCPSCDLQHVTQEYRPHTPMHPCRALSGILAPFVEVTGIELDRRAAHHVVHKREDYVGNELVRKDANGVPIMSLSTIRRDGSNDLHVFAPTATARAET
jgi:hypothetical protein